MIKNIFLISLFLLSVIFFLFTASQYISEKTKKKISLNRENIDKTLNEYSLIIPTLKNDTNNVIEFNSGFNLDKDKPKRNFWKLFNK